VGEQSQNISLLVPEQRDEAAEVLADAFRDNPVCVGTLRGASPEARRKKLGRLYRGFAAACLRVGEASAVLSDGKIVAVALAYPPGRYPFSFGTWLVNGVRAALVGPGHTIRLARPRRVDAKAPFPGTALVSVPTGSPAVAAGKGARHPAASQAHRDRGTRSRPLLPGDRHRRERLVYARFGYRVTDDKLVPGVGVRMWLMLRD
jgi:hypothetical protein